MGFSRKKFAQRINQIVLPTLLFIAILYCDYGIRNLFKTVSKNLTLDLSKLYGSTYGFLHVLDDDFNEFSLKSYIPTAQKYLMTTTILKKYKFYQF